MAGQVEATGLATHAELRLGPAALFSAETTQRHNAVWFPFGFELAHDGDLAQLPRLSARPDLRRAVYGRERVSFATRLVRVEMSGDDIPKKQAAGPGARVPQSVAIDVIALHGSVEATMQGGLRLETTVGGALFAALGRIDGGVAMELLGYEHREVKPPGADGTGMGTFWIIRTEYANPRTGSRYFLGWGEVVSVPDESRLRELLEEIDDGEDEQDDAMTVGGIAWWSTGRGVRSVFSTVATRS